ncbi:MAG: hypothetical protein ABIK66_06175 [candidate division WOR-3 bacterium]
MKEKIKTQKGFIQIPLLIMAIVSIVVVGGIGYGGVEYHKASKAVGEAEQLAREEKYKEAIEKLEFAQDSWLTKNLGIKRQEITNKIEKNKTLLEDKLKYIQGIEEFSKGNWEEAKELLLKVSELSPHYQDAQNKIEEAERKITEEITKKAQKEIEKEQARRTSAETQLEFERQLSQQQISELQRQREEAEKRWAEAETKRAIEKGLRMGHLLQDYYNRIREMWGVILPVMQTVNQKICILCSNFSST